MLTPVIIFLIKTLFNLYAGIVLLRLILRYIRADFYNPLSQFVIRITNPALFYLKKIFPNIKGWEVSAIFLFIFVLAAETAVLNLILGGSWFWLGLLAWWLAMALNIYLSLLTLVIIADVLLSWLRPHEITFKALFAKIAYPACAPFRRFIKPIAGFDLTPLFALLAVQVVSMLTVDVLLRYVTHVL